MSANTTNRAAKSLRIGYVNKINAERQEEQNDL